MILSKPEQDSDSRSEVSNNWSESRIADDIVAELQQEHDLEQGNSEPEEFEHVNIPLDKRLKISDDRGCQLI